MITMYFFSPGGLGAITSSGVAPLIGGYHWWADTFATWVFGVLYPRPGVHPLDVAAAMTAAGAYTLPSVHDTAAVPGTVATALTAYGVLSTDLTFACATKMYTASGVLAFRPSLFLPS